MKKNLCLITLTFLLTLLISVNPFAQVNLTSSPYTENFDNIGSGYPTGWTGRTGASSSSLGTTQTLTTTKTAWNNTTGAFKNFASADGLNSGSSSTDQSNSTDRALGVRQTGSFGDPGAAFTLQIANTNNLTGLNISFKLQSLDSTSARSVTWIVQYGLGTNPTSFTNVTTSPSTLTTGGSTWKNTTVTLSLPTAVENQNQNVWIRIVTLSASSGTGNRPSTGIDDFQLTFSQNSGIIADHLEISNVPTSQQVNVPFTVTICAKDPSGNIQTDYTNPINLLQFQGGTADISPTPPQVPSGGCVSYTVTPLFAPDSIIFRATSGTLTPDTTSEIFVYNPLNTCYTDANCGFKSHMVQTNSQNDIWTCANSIYTINGFCNGCVQPNTEGWLVSPKFQLNTAFQRHFDFDLVQSFVGPAMQLYYTTNFTGNPATTSWILLGNVSGSGAKSFNISSVTGSDIQFAFKYTADGTSGGSAAYTVSNLKFLSDDCNNTILLSCSITDISQWNINGCNNQGTTSTLDDTYNANVTVTFGNNPNAGNLNLYANNIQIASVAASTIHIDSTTYTFTNVNLPANNNVFSVSALFTADSACNYSTTLPARPSCSPAAGIAYNPALETNYYTDVEFTVNVCFVDENNIPSPQPSYPSLTFDISPAIGQIISGPNGSGPCFSYTILPMDTGAVAFTVFDSNLDYFTSENTHFSEKPCVFISEVVDPTSGNNKFLEVYNGSDFAVDISNYKLKIYTNGSTSATYTLNVNAGTLLQPTETYAFRNTSAGQDFSACGSRITISGNFTTNGDDAFEWVEGAFIHDRYGVVGEQPGTNITWNYADKVVTRKPNIYCGNPTFVLAEWSMEPYTANNEGSPCNHCVTPLAMAEKDTLCTGDTLFLSGKGGASYNWTGPNSFSSSIQKPVVPNINTAGTGWYILTITTENTCTDLTDSIYIQVNDPVSAMADVTPDTVYVGGSANFSSSGGDSYSWSGPNGFNSSLQNFSLTAITLTMAGTYTVTVTGLCGQDTASVNLTVLSLPDIQATADPNPACTGDTVQLDVNPEGLSYSWTGPNGFSSNIKNPLLNNVDLSFSGDYFVTVTYPGDLELLDTVNLMIYPPIEVSIQSDPYRDTFCFNSNLKLFTSGNFESYEWKNPEDSIISVTDTAFIILDDITNAGNYSVKVTDGNGCTGVDTFTVFMHQQLSYTISDSIVCHNDSLHIFVPNLINYTVVDESGNSANFNGESIFPMEGRNSGQWYIWIYDNTTSCNTLDSFFITVLDGPIIDATASPNPACEGTNVQLDVVTLETGTYSWTGPAGFNSILKNPIINNFQSANIGDYIVQMVDSNGCTSLDTIAVNLLNAPTIVATASPNPACQGNNVQLDVITNDSGIFSWTGPAGFSSSIKNPVVLNIQPNQAGNYMVTMTFANGCISRDTVTVTVNPAPPVVATATPNPVCVGGTVQFNATGSGTFSWTGPNGFTSSIQNPVINNVSLLNEGNYIVTMTTSTGCINKDTVFLDVNQLPTLSVSATPNPICVGELLSLSASGSGSFNWSGPLGFSSNNQNPQRRILELGMGGIYYVKLTDMNGCNATGNVNVTVLPGVTASAWTDNVQVCKGETAMLYASGGTNYSWTGPNGFVSNMQNPVIPDWQPENAGLYIVTVENTSGCKGMDTIKMDVIYPPVAAATYDLNSACEGADLHLYGKGAGSYSWTGPGGWTSNEINPVRKNANASMSGLYILTVTGQNGCQDTASLLLKIYPSPNLAITQGPIEVCEGEGVQLNADGDGVITWTGPYTYRSDIEDPYIANIPSYMTGYYVATIVGETGCIGKDSVYVKVFAPANTAAFAEDNNPCQGGRINLHAIGGSTYLWTGPNGFHSTDPDPVIYNVSPGNNGEYQVLIWSGANCFSTYILKIEVKALKAKPFAYASPNPVTEGGSTRFFASPGLSYAWSGPLGFTSNVQNPVLPKVVKSMAGNYYCKIVDSSGCVITPYFYLWVNGIKLLQSDGANSQLVSGVIYPNPASSEIILESKNATSIIYWIYTSEGKLVQKGESNDLRVDINLLQSGVYRILWKEKDSSEILQNNFVKIK